MQGIANTTYELVPNCVTTSDGSGQIIDCRSQRGELLVVTLAIDSVLQQESIAVSISGSPDGIHWGAKPLACFAEKSYCGVYSILLNLADHAEIQYLRAQWTLRRWDKKAGDPMFVFHLYAEPSGSRLRRSVLSEISQRSRAALRAAG